MPIVTQPWTRSPPYPVPLDASHPLARGAVALVPSWLVTTSGDVCSQRGGGNGAGVLGACRIWTQGQSSAATRDVYSGAWSRRSESITVLVVQRYRSVPSGTGVATVGLLNSSAAGHWRFASNTSNVMQVYARDAAATARSVNGPSVDTLPHVLVLRISNRLGFFVDGINEGQSQSFTWSVPDASMSFVLGHPANVSPNFDCHLVIHWPYALTDAQIAQISRNPFSLFQPQTLWVSEASTMPTLSDATAIDVTTTSFRSRVAYTF